MILALVILEVFVATFFIISLVENKAYAWLLLILQSITSLTLDFLIFGANNYFVYRLSTHLLFVIAAFYIYFIFKKNKNQPLQKAEAKSIFNTLFVVLLMYLLSSFLNPFSLIYVHEFITSPQLMMFNSVDVISLLAIVFLANRYKIGLYLALLWKMVVLDISLFSVFQHGLGVSLVQALSFISLAIAVIFLFVKSYKINKKV